jgi:hypothetical protein
MTLCVGIIWWRRSVWRRKHCMYPLWIVSYDHGATVFAECYAIRAVTTLAPLPTQAPNHDQRHNNNNYYQYSYNSLDICHFYFPGFLGIFFIFITRCIPW